MQIIFAEIVNPAEERSLYIKNVCPFLSFEGKVFSFYEWVA